jgi:hypothetical protein
MNNIPWKKDRGYSAVYGRVARTSGRGTQRSLLQRAMKKVQAEGRLLFPHLFAGAGEIKP